MEYIGPPDDSCPRCGVERGVNHVHETDWAYEEERRWEEETER